MLWLVPNTLDLGTPEAASTDLRAVLPQGVLDTAARLGHWVCENAKTTRAFLKRVDAIVPLAQPLQALTGQEYLDFVGGIAVCALGHSSTIVSRALEDQSRKLVHVSN